MSDYKYKVSTYDRKVIFPVKSDMFGYYSTSIEFTPINKLSVDVEAKNATQAIYRARNLTGRLYGEILRVEPLNALIDKTTKHNTSKE